MLSSEKAFADFLRTVPRSTVRKEQFVWSPETLVNHLYDFESDRLAQIARRPVNLSKRKHPRKPTIRFSARQIEIAVAALEKREAA